MRRNETLNNEKKCDTNNERRRDTDNTLHRGHCRRLRIINRTLPLSLPLSLPTHLPKVPMYKTSENAVVHITVLHHKNLHR